MGPILMMAQKGMRYQAIWIIKLFEYINSIYVLLCTIVFLLFKMQEAVSNDVITEKKEKQYRW